MNLSKNKKLVFILLTFIFQIAVLISVEILLTLFNYGGNTNLFIIDKTSDKTQYILNPNFTKRYFFKEGIKIPNPRKQVFSQKKGENTIRIFCLGASTTQGVPYPLHASFPTFLDSLLSNSDTSHVFEVINCGITAVTSHTVLDMAREIVEDYDPDLLIVYSGHNEFYGVLGTASIVNISDSQFVTQLLLRLQKSRLVLLLRNAFYTLFADAVTKDNVVDPNTLMGTLAENVTIPINSNVFQQTNTIYQQNLEDLIKVSKEENVHLILCNLVDNLLMEPVGSQFSKEDTLIRIQVTRLLENAKYYLSQQELDSARSLLLHAIDLDSLYADTHYYLGQLFLKTGEIIKAKKSFIKARDLDIIRFRAPGSFNKILEEICNKNNIPLVNLDTAFSQISPDKITGYNLILEHIHPNAFGYFKMAETIFTNILNEQILPIHFNNLSMADSLTFKKFNNLTLLSEEVVRMGVYKLAQYWPFKKSSDPESYVPTGDSTTKKLAYNYVFGESISLHQLHLDYGYFLFKNRNYKEALKEIRTSLLVDQSCEAYNFLGTYYADQVTQSLKTKNRTLIFNNYQKAVSSFNKGIKICPNDYDIYFNLGLVHSINDQNLESAAEAFKKVLESNPYNKKATDFYISSLLKLKNYDEAKNVILRGLKNFPREAGYLKNLGKIYLIENDLPNARKSFEKSLNLKPGDKEVESFLIKIPREF